MRRLLVLLLLLSVGCASASTPPASSTSSAVGLPAASAPAAPRVRLPVPAPLDAPDVLSGPTTTFALPNGLTVVVVERHRRPIVSVRLVFPTGSVTDPPDQAGVTNLAFALLGEIYERDAAGRRYESEKSLRRQMTELGGSYHSSVRNDASMIGVDGYSRDLEPYLTRLAEGVSAPRASEAVFEAYRESIIHGIEELEESDGEVLQQELTQASFGAGHPYARPATGTLDSLDRLTIEQVRAVQKRALSPSRATLVVVGDVTAARVAKMSLRIFAGWTQAPPARGKAPPAQVQVPPPLPGPRAASKLIARVPATTSLVCVARALGDVDASDASAEVLAHVLGDGISSRLAALREQHGWSYSPGATVVRRRAGRGLLMCARIDARVTSEALAVLWSVLADARTSAPSAAELERARTVLLARAQLGDDEVGAAMSRVLERLVLGSSVEERTQRLRAVTLEGVRAAAERVLDPARLHVIVVGPDAVARAALEKQGLGPVQRVRLGEVSGGRKGR